MNDGREVNQTVRFRAFDLLSSTNRGTDGRGYEQLRAAFERLSGTRILAGIAQFERDLMSERIKSGLAAAKARGKKLGRQKGQRPKSDRLAPKFMAMIEEGRSYRWIARDLGISKNTVLAISKRS